MIRHGGRGRGGRSRPPVVRCKCKSHCTTLNPVTGIYEGDGVLQTRSTRDNHMEDDRVLTAINLNAASRGAEEVATTDLLQQVRDEINLIISQPLSDPARPFIFTNKPQDNGPFVWPSDDDLLLPNHGLHSLQSHSAANRPYLLAENRLHELHRWISNPFLHQPSQDVDSVLDYISGKMGDLIRLKEIEWCQQRGNSGRDFPYVNTEAYFGSFGPSSPRERVSVFLSLVMENIFFTPRRTLRALLAGAKSLLRSNGASATVLAEIPVDPRSGNSRARLNPVTRHYVACPKCHKLYPLKPGDSPLNSINPFISICRERRTLESEQCNTPLWKERAKSDGNSYLVPIRKYVHQDLKSWFGRLLSRKGMEALIDEQNVYRDPLSSETPIVDIWTAKVFQELKDISGNMFIPGPPGEGRLVFSLSVDSFNPFHNKTAKQSASSTGIWMVLLNLPPHLRYRHENMYVAGVIPGPEKPSKEDIYPYIELVRDDLLEFWFKGVRFSRTESNIFDRLYKAMLIPLICDMLAARQISGLSAATSHNFCTFCELDIDDINIVDRSEWPPKELAHIHRIADLWKNARNVKDQETIFESYGIRWSPLHTLPYWDVIRFTVIDPMHALDLNLFQNHCRNIFQIDAEAQSGDGIGPSVRRERNLTSKDHIRSLRQCISLIESNDIDLIPNLLLHHRSTLHQICVDNRIFGEGHRLIVGTKWILANNISVWRNSPIYQQVTLQDESQIEDEPEVAVSQTPELPIDSGLDRALIIRILRNLFDEEDTEASRARAYGQASVAAFLYICKLVHIPTDDINPSRKIAKTRLYERIIQNIDIGNSISRDLKSYIPRNESPRVVLGINIMEEVWADMTRTQLPTWVTPAPPDWGTVRRGKLTADNWRVVCAIHLPITLIRLWGNGTERKQQMLTHFMDLVAAVRIANMRITSPNQIEEYNRCMSRYISQIRTLYPDQTLKPSHHAALHIGDMLGLFGPNHSHSGPHYERYINFFHRVNTNKHIGELETTLLYTSARSANIRALLSDDRRLRSSILELVEVMDNVDKEDARGFRLASILDPDLPTYTQRSKAQVLPLDPMHHQMLCSILGRADCLSTMPRQATYLKEISREGVCYGISTASTFKNSGIMFRSHHSEDSVLHAGISTHLFCYHYPTALNEHTEGHFFVVQTLLPIDDQPDPYRKFNFGGYLCRRSGVEQIISLSQVVSHCALTRLTTAPFTGLLHVLPLDRLMLEFDGMGLVSREAPASTSRT